MLGGPAEAAIAAEEAAKQHRQKQKKTLPAPPSSPLAPSPVRRFQAGCLYFGGLIYEDPKQGNKLYYNGGRHEFTTM